jgi:L-lactate dehydrogenase complex protein LldG
VADSARETMLQRIRAALADRPAPPAVERSYLRNGIADPFGLFAERIGDYRATVEIIGAAALPRTIGKALVDRAARRIVVPADLPAAWLAEADIEAIRDAPPLSVHDLDAADGVVTGAAVGIALTGTIVLDAGPTQGRRALSLLPDFHLCVVRADQVVGTVPEAIARLDPVRPQTWISGPSATSDIELNRVEGVHGPRTLHVLVVV